MSKIVLKNNYPSELYIGLILIFSFGLLSSNVLGFNNNNNNENNKDELEHSFRHNKQHFRSEEHQQHVNRVNKTTPHVVYLRHHNNNHHHHHHHSYSHPHQQLQHEHHPHPTLLENRMPSHVHSTTTQASFTKHHLRHYNRHHQTWEQRVFPSLRHQQTTTTTTTSPPPSWAWMDSNRHHLNNFTSNVQRRRYFDRDSSIYAPPLNNEFTTQGPYIKSNDLHERSSLRNIPGRNKNPNDFLFSSGDTNMDSLEFISSNEDEDDTEMMFADEGKQTFRTRNNKSKNKSKQQHQIIDSLENMDDYYDDENSVEGKDKDDDDNVADDSYPADDNDADDDYSNEEEDETNNKNNAYDMTTIRVDDRNLFKNKPIDNSDTEDIYSRSYIPGTLTRYKYEMFGTHEAVERSRMSHITNQKQHRALANAHASKVYMEAACKYPKPRVEKIQKDPSKVYVPHCTILHRCADDTGCCSTESHTCVAKRTQNVDLYFFVKAFGSKKGTVERHTFINHTECHCVEKAHHLKYPPAPAMLRQATILDCTCPKLFEKVLQEDGYCRCDCSSGNSGCDWLKRGMEHFSVVDRKCINEGRCKPPTCEFGSYIKKHGRCPRKDDKLTSYSSGFL